MADNCVVTNAFLSLAGIPQNDAGLTQIVAFLLIAPAVGNYQGSAFYKFNELKIGIPRTQFNSCSFLQAFDQAKLREFFFLSAYGE